MLVVHLCTQTVMMGNNSETDCADIRCRKLFQLQEGLVDIRTVEEHEAKQK